MYANCPLCSQKASVKTIKKTGECNDCQSKRILSCYNEKNYRISKIKSQFASDLLVEFIEFIAKSSWKHVLQSRMVIDFIKILSGYTGNVKIVSSQLEVDYFRKSSIKSPTIIFTIKAFLISKKLLILDIEHKQENFFPEDIRPENRFQQDICDYFFSEKRCHDCGRNLTEKSQHSFCYDCVAYRTVFRRTTFEYVDSIFNNSSIKGLYYYFIQYLYGLNRTVQTYAEILGNTEKYFTYLQDFIPSGLKFYPFIILVEKKEYKYKVISGNKYLNIFLSNDWLLFFEKKFSKSNSSKEFFFSFFRECRVAES
ncbi:hypothetical protein ACIQZG_01225 [Lysinibacillus sp. NPDC096418]|uniref:hypothetical protein n=1 Tax=Lysinibacillus sp. NPDC096418 TaxID=3364138 RepID=UPI003829D7EA